MQGQETRTVCVVGGSGGIGAAVCEQFATPGYKLFIHGGHDGPKLEALAERLRGSAAAVETLLHPVDTSSEVHHLVDILVERVQPDILICAFGPMTTAPIDQTDSRQWETMVACNLLLPGLLASRFLPGMRERHYGRFVFFGLAGKGLLTGYQECPAYASAKQGLSILAKSIAKSYTKDGISALVLCPGYVETEYLDEVAKVQLAKRTPSGSLQKAEELAEMLAFFVTKGAFLLNGATIEAGSGI